MIKLFLFLVIALAIVTVSEPVKAVPAVKLDCKKECWTYQSWGQTCTSCQTNCYTYDPETGEAFLQAWGPITTTCGGNPVN